MRFRAIIEVAFKNSVLEPKGGAVMSAMQSKYKNTDNEHLLKKVENIRVGNITHVLLQEKSIEAAQDSANKIAEDFLCNPTIEKFHIKIETL